MVEHRIRRDLRVYQSALVGITLVLACALIYGGLVLKHDRKYQRKAITYGSCYVAYDGDMICPPTRPGSQAEGDK